ncbi:Uncharacterized protein TCAP_05807 [Tolypocladium capitatum]|uniref:protein disulfide-isomerase n=1 Tax=Tolypocladium capitatum TaxID=45235 RepID=A0A2K3Q9M6_9HYPO|nr:Uncharacterized protein TCAP_05807 [Tolypocladium capitatum]
MHHPALATTVTAVLAALPAVQAGMYTKKSPVLQVDARSYERLIVKSNHTSIVEFYAPWCGHCQNLKPAYEQAARDLEGLAKVVAVDCDDEANKQFCGTMGVQGFPTLKIVRPSKKPGGKPVVEDYQGPRTATGIAEALAAKINNHVTRVEDKDLAGFLAGDRPRALLFTEKGTTSALLRSIAIDFLDVISVGQVRNKDKATVEKFGVEKFPTLVLIPGEGKEPITYTGKLVKKDMVEFLSQAGQPNPDPAPSNGKTDKSNKKKSSTKPADKEADKASGKKSAAEPEASTETSTATTATESATQTPDIIPITAVTSMTNLADNCLQSKSLTCVLAFVPSDTSEKSDRALESLSQLNTKYIRGRRYIFPFFSVPSSVEGSSLFKDSLQLSGDVELIALNARREWWRHYEGDFSVRSIESWIDEMRMGDGKKNSLPKVVVDQAETATESSTKATHGTDAEPEVETEAPKPQQKIVHGEL